MIRLLALLAALVAASAGAPAYATDFSVLARVDPARTGLDEGRRATEVHVGLSQGVPYRVYTLDAPRRVVVELSEVRWDGLDPSALTGDRVTGARAGQLAPGWSGLVLDLARPMEIASAQMRTEPGAEGLHLRLVPSDAAAFATSAGAPAGRAAISRRLTEAPAAKARPVVVIDPGHGGRDPGAVVAGVAEAPLMLTMAVELRAALRRAGDFDVHLTRETDAFVGLAPRAALARRVGADLFVSLHADALAKGQARGATVYLLSEDATDSASALLAERLDRGAILSGTDLRGQDDTVATVLMDIARRETAPRTEALAGAIIEGMRMNGARLNGRPGRRDDFAVLRSADVPSVLVEVGFLSSKADRIELQSPEKRARIVDGIAAGIVTWLASGGRAEGS
ncbi:MAG: N-acetylmuramoyl-L-alanine amidase [Shimia sp.]